MAREPIFGADDLRHPEHAGPNPFADVGSPEDSGGIERPHSNPLASTESATDYHPTGYTPALAPRGRRLMILASAGTLLAGFSAAGSLLFRPVYVVTLLTPALTVSAITMCTQDLRAMRAGAMGRNDLDLTVGARRVAVVGLTISAIASWPWIQRIGSLLVSVFS